MWLKYYLLRYRKYGKLSKKEKKTWMKNGVKGYKKMIPFEEFIKENRYLEGLDAKNNNNSR